MIFLGLLLFGVTGRDDVFKTFWSAYSLSEFGAILNYNGVPLEQSSSLLEVLILGGLRSLFGGDIVVYGYGLGILGGVGTVFLTVKVGRQLKLPAMHQHYLPWLVATSSFLVYWSFSGMETSLQCCCVLGVLSGILNWLEHGHKGAFILSLIFFLLCRPENPFLLCGLLSLAVIFSKPYGRGCFKMLVLTIAGTVLLFGLRYAAFGMWFPLPVYAKASGLSFTKFYHGGGFLFKILMDHPTMILVTLAIGWGMGQKLRKLKASPTTLLLLLWLGLGLTFVMLVGGDWMENGRFIVPFIPLGLLCLPDLGKWGKWLFPLLLVVQLAGTYWTARYQSTGQPIWTEHSEQEAGQSEFPFFVTQNRIHARDMEMVRALDNALGEETIIEDEPVRILSQQAGMVAYYTAVAHFGKIEFIDLVGLTSMHFHQCSLTQDRGHGVGGLNMDLDYLYANSKELSATCGFQMPRFVFDLDNERWERLDIFQSLELNTIAKTSGEIKTNTSHFPGLEVRKEQFLVDGR